jgi:hypothetical protein
MPTQVYRKDTVVQEERVSLVWREDGERALEVDATDLASVHPLTALAYGRGDRACTSPLEMELCDQLHEAWGCGAYDLAEVGVFDLSVD